MPSSPLKRKGGASGTFIMDHSSVSGGQEEHRTPSCTLGTGFSGVDFSQANE